MNFLALLAALLLTYYRPHRQLDLLQHLFHPYAHWLERNLNDGKKLHGLIAWILGALIPTLLIGAVYFILWYINFLPGLLFSIVALYLTLRFSQFERRAEQIVSSLRDQNIDLAREQYKHWEGNDADNYSHAQLSRVSIESTLKRAHYGLFGPIFWFAVLGPAGAVLYRLAYLLKVEWHPQDDNVFNHFAEQVFEVIDWLPARVTAVCFAIVGDFEDAIYCWRTQAATWPNKALGIILASGGGALGVKLGEPLPYKGVIVFRPELGLGDEADADCLQSAIGLVWRVLFLMVGILLLLTFAHWLGH
ncbi:MAG: adenosylcobinamide-phosphate synthase [Betaproteobacteria bacterium HGW-Betaproteobacteria-8]|nr:MAG: adenosylcobinamide-phosphate synthase [Betaproteobacteria bacterium HGW-Betaproteobacteria-8]